MPSTFQPFRRQTPLAPDVFGLVSSHRLTGYSLSQRPLIPSFGSMRHLGFALNPQARRDNWPNHVRYPMDKSFTSRCSPPCLTAAQLCSVTKIRPIFSKDFHLADTVHLQAHGFPLSREGQRTADFAVTLARP